MRNLSGVIFAVGCFGLLSGCGMFDWFSSDEPNLRDDHTAVISGLDTSNLDPKEARRNVLLVAAHVTVDNGYQYFTVVHREVWTPSGEVAAGTDNEIRPGDDVTIKVFHDGEISSGTRGVFDAQRLLSNGVSDASASTPGYMPPATWTPSDSTPGASQTPHCTAYGCSW